MTTAQLKTLTLENFRGISKTFEFSPGRNVYAGPNGSGKTTLPEAERFVRDGNINFEVKSIVDGQKQQKGEHTVKAVYDIGGQSVELGRTYFEKWGKKRGALEETKSGNESRYYVDGIDVKKKAYSAKLLELFGGNYDKCTDIGFLPSMHWKELRTLLSGLAPVDSGKVICSIDGLQELLVVEDKEKNVIRIRTIEESKTAADQRKKKIAEQIGNIPAQIQEHQTILDSTGGKNEAQAQEEIEAAYKAVEVAKAKIDAINQGDDSVEKLRKLNEDLIKAESEFNAKQSAAREKENERQKAIRGIDIELRRHDENLADHEEAKEKAAAEYWAVHNSKPEDVTTCVTCGQDLPKEKVADLQENFNLNKAKKLEEIKARGGDLKKEIARIQGLIEVQEKKKAELEAVKPDPILSRENSKEILDIGAEIAALKTVDHRTVPAELTATIEASEARLEHAREIKAQIAAVSGSRIRIEELTAKKAELSAENDKVEKFLSLYQQYNKALADATEGPVNELFSVVNFRMFKELEGGGIVEACEIFDKQWRPYHGALSNGEQVRAGVDMVSTLQKQLGVSGPVFLDNCESVTGDIEMDCQFVELRATDEFETLTKVV